ncbi:histidyl-tRNA synthetase [Marchantia polymorpha subsp. ruderalis]
MAMAAAAAASSQHLGLALITSLACLRGRAGAITSAASKSCRLELDKLVPQLNAHGALSGFQGSRGYILREPICRPRSLSASATTQESVRGPSQAGPPSTDGGVIDTSPPRGTRDFPPEDMRLRTWLFNNFREVSSLFGFEEIDFPVLESEELYIRKAGEEITQQLYNFEDKGGRRVTLRPELTPSLARLVLQKGKSASLPLKWFAIGQCWRYERMTRGRRREHYQWNMDIIGIPGVEAEAELLSAIVAFFSKLGITSSDVGIKISNRKVLQEVLGRSVIPESSFAAVCVIVDKIEKIPRAEVEKELTALGLPVEAVDTILRALTLRSLDDLEELLGSDNEAVVELKQLFELARGYGFEDWLQFDASVVRGLAYYTGTVFEAFDRTGTLRAICGGGRYDKLLSTFGGVDTPACGFGFGDAVIVELLKEKKLLPELNHEVDDIVMPLEEELRPQAAIVAARLRTQGRRVDVVMGNKKMKWAFKHAERLQAKRMVILGSTEWTKGSVRVKDLSSREEKDLPLEEL